MNPLHLATAVPFFTAELIVLQSESLLYLVGDYGSSKFVYLHEGFCLHGEGRSDTLL